MVAAATRTRGAGELGAVRHARRSSSSSITPRRRVAVCGRVTARRDRKSEKQVEGWRRGEMWGDVGRSGEIAHLVCNGCELLVDECTQLANGQMHLPRVTTGSVVRGGHATCRRGRDHHHGEDTSARGGEEGRFKWSYLQSARSTKFRRRGWSRRQHRAPTRRRDQPQLQVARRLMRRSLYARRGPWLQC